MTANERRFVLGIAIAVVLCGNLLLPWLFVGFGSAGNGFMVAFLLGFTVAEIGLLSIWCALADQSTHLRWSLTSGILLIGYGLFLVGLKLQEPDLQANFAAVLLLYVLATFAGIQMPLWFTRYSLRLRIGLPGESHAQRNSGRFSIRYLLAATAAIGFIIALVNAASVEGTVGGSLVLWLLGLLLMLLVAIFAATLCLPCIWLILSERRSTITVAANCSILIWLGGPLLVLLILAGAGPDSNAIIFLLVLYAFVFAAGGGTAAGMLILRGLEYRLLTADQQGNLHRQRDRGDWPNESLGPQTLPPIVYPNVAADPDK
jgi:hypothetical protein